MNNLDKLNDIHRFTYRADTDGMVSSSIGEYVKLSDVIDIVKDMERQIAFWASHTPTDVFIEDYEMMKAELAHATIKEQVWRAEWEQISEQAKQQQELIQYQEPAVEAARHIGNFFGLRYMMAWNYESLPSQVEDKVKEIEGKE